MSNYNSDNVFLLALGVIGTGVVALLGHKKAKDNNTSFVEGVFDVVDEGISKFTTEAIQTQKKSLKKLSSQELIALYNNNDTSPQLSKLAETELDRRNISY